MTLKLYGMSQSTCTQRVLAVLFEKNLDYELIEINLMTGDQKSAAHIARHPFGKVPVLDDDGFLVFESRAISKYLALKFATQGTQLMPKNDDFEGYGLFEQAASIEQNYFNPSAEGIAIEKVFKQFRGQAADELKVKEHGENLDKALSCYDTILSKQKFLAGNQITVVDMFHLPYIKINKAVGFAEIYNKYPHVKNWSETLEALDSWRKVLAL